MRVDAVIAELQEDAGASKLSQDKLRLAVALRGDIEDLRAEIRAGAPTRTPAPAAKPYKPVPLAQAMERFEKQHVLRALAERGTVKRAAADLCVSEDRIYLRLQAWNYLPPKKVRGRTYWDARLEELYR